MRRFFAVLLMLVFWLVMPISFLLFNIKATFLNADYYKAQLNKHQAYSLVTKTLAEELLTFDLGIPLFIDLEAAISDTWLQGETEKILDGTFGLLKPGAKLSDLEKLNINFSDPKTQAIAELDNKMSTLPPCTDEQMQQIGDPEEVMEALPHLECLPEGMTFSEMSFDELLPNEMGLLGLMNLEGEDLQTWQSYLDQVHFYLWIATIVIVFGFILSAILFLVMGLLFIKEAKSWLRWWGWTLFIPGLIGLPLFIGPKIYLRLSSNELVASLFNIPPQFQGLNSLIFDLIYALVNGFLNRMLWPVGISFVVGLTLLIVAIFIKKKSKNLTK